LSVHAEYGRALQVFTAHVRGLADPRARDWTRALEAARVDADRDLSSAARACLAALDSIERSWVADAASGAGPPVASALRDAFEHLHAHCRIVLGLPR